MSDEFPDHEAAVDDCTATTDPQVVAHLKGELHELLALEESDYALAVADLGMEVDPPRLYSRSGWLAHLAEGLGGFKADYGPGPGAG
ncbi:contact-dependent growth inhibition system immunity protein [Streptomyces sp. CACIS-1.16CA]|uniref:contact-dependent growth inhibition system immunity protein n=1 Tax=Streptomyces sp. CACIS-1.16CA TaxID=1175510 RepID=UPI0037D776C7